MHASSPAPAMPAPLAELAGRHLEHLQEAFARAQLPWPPPNVDAALLAQLPRVLAGSDYVARTCAGNPAMFAALLAGGDLTRAYTVSDMAANDMRAHVETAVRDVGDDEALMRSLRLVRQREMVRIIWRDLTGAANLAEVIGDLSALADACIDLALEKITLWNERDFGVPIGEQSGKPQKMIVLGMGKLGAHELNLSSDVDLIFSYPEEGETTGRPRTLSNHEFFTNVGRRLIRVLDAATDDGFVFRVDMRLRPWGASGALAASVDAMENYYEEQGRPWERYAMIKARAVAGDIAAGAQLLQRLRPFVYRRYLDFSAFESLRELKGMIAREVRRKDMANNIKLGAGGIREIEFIVQAFQLVRGGVDKQLQERALLPVLDMLVDRSMMSAPARDELATAYDFLRRTEHRLQALDDAQTHALPDDDIARLRVAFAMGYADWTAFLAVLDLHRARVEKHFREVLALPDDSAGTTPAMNAADDEAADIWLGQLPQPAAIASLESMHLNNAAAVLAILTAFREDRALPGLQMIARERLDHLMPLLLRQLAGYPAADVVLARILKVLTAVLRRSVYMVLLTENVPALVELIKLCAASEWISDEVARHPFLLDELIHAGTLYAPPKLDDLRADLRAQLARIPQDNENEDIEQQMEVLRHFRLAHVLKVAASDLMGTLPLMKVSDYLTWIAEAILGEVLHIVWHNLVAKHGAPCRDDGTAFHADGNTGFAMIAYGKLGGIELSYGSDLDLVFLYDAPTDGMTDGGSSRRPLTNEAFYLRLVQRIINMLTTRTASGLLYDVDMRLRPSGASGLLVSSLSAFAKYQQESAWTWEHQALARARPVAGDPVIAAAMTAIRHEVLCRPRPSSVLRTEVAAMRDKMIAHLGLAADAAASEQEKTALFDIKHDPGGIVDIEFLVQYLVLQWSSVHPELTRYTDNVRQLDAIASAGLLPVADVDLLRSTYLVFRTRIHRLALAMGKPRIPATEYADARAAVRRIWQSVFGTEKTNS